MANFTARRRTPAAYGMWYPWVCIAAGGGFLFYLLLRPIGGGIPGWQPVNDSVRASLAAPASASHGESSPNPSPVAGAATAGGASTHPIPPLKKSAPVLAVLDLNAASVEQLDGLPGIGPSKANAIAAYRDAHHGFRSVDELLQVKGIGPTLFGQIRSLVAVNMRQ